MVRPPYRVRVAVATDPLLVTERRVSDSVEAGQFVPFARQTDCPDTVRVLRRRDEPEAEVKARLVEVVFVPVALVQIMLVKLEGEEPLTVRLVKNALVANRLVDVELVDVVLAKYPFQRRDDEPRFCAASVRGLMSVEAPPIKARYVEVVWVPVAYVQTKLVALPVPIVALVRIPFVIVPLVANRLVEVVLVPVALVHVRFVKLEGVVPLIVRLVNVAFVPVMFVTPAFVAKRLVDVALVDVVFAKYPFQRSDDDPRDKRASTIGLKLVVAPPVTARYVEVV